MLLTYSREKEITAEALKEFIDVHKQERIRYERLEDLYMSRAPILELEDKPDNKPDNRLVVNFPKYITDTFNGFFLGIPVKIIHKNAEVSDRINEFARINNLDDIVSEMSKICSIYGHAFEFMWQDEDSKTRITYNSPKDMFVVYDDTIACEPLFGVRYREVDGEISGQLYTDSKIYDFNDSYILTESGDLYYGFVPIIEYVENEERQSIYECVETLVNAYDKAISEKANDVDYFSDSYMKILGALLDEESIGKIRDNRIINIEGANSEKLVVDFLDKPQGDQTQENLLTRIERLIFTLSMVANINDDTFGNASGVSLEFKLQPMKNLAAMKERKFVTGFYRRFQMWFNIPTNVPVALKDEWSNLDFTFTRNLPRNLNNEAEIARDLEGVVSKETQLSVLSLVDSVQNELERIELERGAVPYSDLEKSIMSGLDTITGEDVDNA